MKGQRIGYIRVSTTDQNTERQLEGIALDRVFTDKASGKDANRHALQEMMAYARAGDCVTVHSLDRLARNLGDLRTIVTSLNAKGVTVEFVSERLTFDGSENPMSSLMLNLLGAFAEFERAIIKRRQAEGISIAKAKGVYKGRKPKLDDQQAAELRQRVAAGETKAVVARALGICRETLYNYLA